MTAARMFWLLVGMALVGWGFAMAVGPIALILTIICMVVVVILTITVGRRKR